MTDVSVELRKLAELAYERELQSNMTRLHESFGQWQQGGFTVWQMESCLSDFVNGTSRALHTTYMLTDPTFSVAYGVRKGVLSLDEIPAQLHPSFTHLLQTIQI